MDKIVLKGCGPYDGEYEFDDGSLTLGELRKIKQVCGLRAGELEDAFNAGDSDVMVAMAVVALERHGKGPVDADFIWNADAAAIDFVGAEVADEVPPAQTPPTGSSGNGSRTSSDLPASIPTPTGVLT